MARFLSLLLLVSAHALSAATPQIAILAYHEVVPVPVGNWAASIEDFTDQLQLLETAGYHVIPIADLHDYLAGKRDTLPSNPVVITVDDGWADAYTNIHPIMKRFKYPWSLYVYPRIVGRGTTYLKWSQILELSRAGVDIQGHTMSHGHLMRTSHPRMTDSEYTAWLEKELAASKALIEEKTGKPVRFLAYPYGEYDDVVLEAAAKYGYAIGLSSLYGPNTRKTNPLELHRFAIEKTTTLARFLEYGLGAIPLQFKNVSPAAGTVATPAAVSAVIASARQLDPSTVRIAVLGEKATGTFDRRTGRVTIATGNLTRPRYHVIVWGDRESDGRRMAGTWTFYTSAGAKARYEPGK